MNSSTDDKNYIENTDDFLTFVGSLELSDTEAGSASSESGSSLPNQISSNNSQRNIFKRKKRKRGNLSSSTRLQQNKKAEMLFLRRRAFELQEQITQLKIAKCDRSASLPRRKSSTGKPTEKAKSKWVELAEAEYDTRLKAEKTNRTLKMLVTKQMAASMTLQATLIKQTASFEMDLLQIHSAANSPKSCVNQSPPGSQSEADEESN